VTVVNYQLPGLDPATAYDPPSELVMAAVYDGLVAFRRSSGAAGLTLVPDLATTLPRPADGGRAYTFTLRRGIRYSTGTPVRASDFLRGIGRQLAFGAAPVYYEGILGAHACHQHPPSCDLSAGIVTNDAAGTVTFHLTQPDPDFLDKLALTLAAPAPPGAPSHPIMRAPFLPGTGPYLISQYRPNASLILVRNPYFRQWSYAAQPAGYPDVIRYRQIADPAKQQAAVEAGRADLVDIINNGQPYRPLALRYPNRVYSGLSLTRGTWYAFLNTRVPPFTSLKARQAVNYAIDRTKIMRLWGFDPGEAAPTCQILPAGFPAHHSYCPYTTGPSNGTWHRPEPAKAVRLAKQSGTTGVPVTVWTFNDGTSKAVAAYLVRVLGELGYRAKLHAVPNAYAAFSTRNTIQVGAILGWLADFPSPSDFFLPLLTCHSLYANRANTLNVARFCDPQVDKLARQAQAAQLTNPAHARRLWTRVDRIVTDQAPWAPLFNGSITVFVSARVQNYQASPFYGPLLDQIWIR
jgi:ABC-type transport system substrate-binding protein